MQAAEEEALGLPSLPHMVAQPEAVVCRMEASFIQAVALPLWEVLATSFPALHQAVLRMQLNCDLRRALSKLPEQDLADVRTPPPHPLPLCRSVTCMCPMPVEGEQW